MLAEKADGKFQAVEALHIAGGVGAGEPDRLGRHIIRSPHFGGTRQMRRQLLQKVELLFAHDRLRVLACGF